MRPPRQPPQSMQAQKVGYGQPPVATRFQKGRSGNPKGRPKGSRNLQNCLEDVLGQRVSVIIDGRTRKLTKVEITVRRLVDAALRGDLKAISAIIKLQAMTVGNTSPHEAEGFADISGLDPELCNRIVSDYLDVIGRSAP